MKKMITSLMLGAALLAPLAMSPAQAQSLNQIQNMEERVQEAKNDGNWSYASQLEQELNRMRLRYQNQRGMGEVRTNGYYYNYPSSSYYNYSTYPVYDSYYYNNDYNRGYYDRWGRWHRY